ncbi:flavin reductase family protein [Lentzea sp. NPDC042327]|uniref:flavin reductase family protein n=1 Tax=Lentzea sp. NPDC042327 TaxID=3154801 RepID=UPI003406C20E
MPRFSRHFTNGVAVLSCGTGPSVHGVTVSTLALASVDPPMVSFALRSGSRGLAALLAAGRFAVNRLAEGQADLARYFASATRGRGQPEVWREGTEVPLLADAAGWLECTVDRVVPTGDHVLVLGRVLRAELGAGAPLSNTFRTDPRS